MHSFQVFKTERWMEKYIVSNEKYNQLKKYFQFNVNGPDVAAEYSGRQVG